MNACQRDSKERNIQHRELTKKRRGLQLQQAQKIKELKNENESMKSKIDQLTQENLSLQTLVQQLTEQNRLLRQENGRLRCRNGTITTTSPSRTAPTATNDIRTMSVNIAQTKSIDNESSEQPALKCTTNNGAHNKIIQQIFEIIINLYQITQNKVFQFLLSWDNSSRSMYFLSQTSQWNQNKQMVNQQLKICHEQLHDSSIFGWYYYPNGIKCNNNNNCHLFICKTIKENGKMGYQTYGSYYKLDFVILGCNYKKNIVRKNIISSFAKECWNSDINNDILNCIVNYLHQSIFMQIVYHETHDHTYDQGCYEMDDVDEYTIKIEFDPTFAICDCQATISSQDMKISRKWGHSSYTDSLQSEFDINLFKTKLLSICNDLEVDNNQYQALLTYLQKYYPKM